MNRRQKRLERIVERNADWREQDRRKAEREVERHALLEATRKAPERKRLDFWCGKCGLDFTAEGVKCLCGGGRSRYDARCPKCRQRRSRRITEPLGDPYYHESRVLSRMRHEAGDDLLQPGDRRFEKVWGHKIRQAESDRLADEERKNYATTG